MLRRFAFPLLGRTGVTTPIPKPEKRKVASQKEWRALRAKLVKGRDHDLHHLVPRSQGGGDVEENLFSIEHSLHLAYEDKVPGWEFIGMMIREEMTEAQKAYVIGKKSEEFLNRRYPLRRENA